MNEFMNMINQAQEKVESKKRLDDLHIGLISKSIYPDLPIYTEYPVFTWVDKKSKKIIRLKFNMDDSIHHEFKIRKNTNTYIKYNTQIISDENIEDLEQEIIEIFRHRFKEFHMELSNIYLDKHKIIFFIKY